MSHSCRTCVTHVAFVSLVPGAGLAPHSPTYRDSLTLSELINFFEIRLVLEAKF